MNQGKSQFELKDRIKPFSPLSCLESIEQTASSPIDECDDLEENVVCLNSNI